MLSLESRQKIGRKIRERNIKLGIKPPSNLGKKHSLETKQKISNSLKGHLGFYKGKHLLEETKHKISPTSNLHIRRNR